MWNKISDVGMPKTGDYSVLAYHVNGSVEMVHCDGLHWSSGQRLYTHWMPLPEAPTALQVESEPKENNIGKDKVCIYHGKDCGYMRFNGSCMGSECSLHPSRHLYNK